MQEGYKFGPHSIDRREVFVESPLSFAFVNLKPIVPGIAAAPISASSCHSDDHQPSCSQLPSTTGHVLVSSKRVQPRFTDLEPSEVSDLWCVSMSVLLVLGAFIKLRFFAVMGRARTALDASGKAQADIKLSCMLCRVLVQRVGKVVEKHWGASSLTLAIQVPLLERHQCSLQMVSHHF